MNQQAIATVILRIVGLTYFYAAITAVVSSGVFSQVVVFNQASEEENISIVAVLVSMIGVQCLFGLLLMIFAKPISKVLFKENEKVNEEKALTASTLIQAAVPIVGLYFSITYFPGFITTAIQWYKEQAGPPDWNAPSVWSRDGKLYHYDDHIFVYHPEKQEHQSILNPKHKLSVN